MYEIRIIDTKDVEAGGNKRNRTPKYKDIFDSIDSLPEGKTTEVKTGESNKIRSAIAKWYEKDKSILIRKRGNIIYISKMR